MTDEEWNGGTDVARMVESLASTTSVRKLRLLGVGVCKLSQIRLLPKPQLLISIVESLADDLAIESELGRAHYAAEGWLMHEENRLQELVAELSLASIHDPNRQPLLTVIDESNIEAEWNEARARHDIALIIMALLQHDGVKELNEGLLAYVTSRPSIAWEDAVREVSNNPFRPMSIDPRWLTSSVLDLARGIYDDRAFERMPILADALMDAGCAIEQIINHCRGPGPHVRGCWVVDLLLGKE